MPRILLTSFEPFGGHAVNSSLEVGRVLAQSPPPGLDLDWLVLPVVATACVHQAQERIAATRPALVLALGQAGSSPRVRLEDRGVNYDHFAFADNGGNLHQGSAIIPGGPVILRTRLPLGDVVAHLQSAGHPVEVSFSAGSFVCNHLYYQLLHATSQQGPPLLFVHLPLLPEQHTPRVRAFTMPLEQQVNCVREVLHRCLDSPG